jgi:hypothetical protein
MTRKARIDATGALQHTICHGIGHRKIFGTDEDRDEFVERLGAYAKLVKAKNRKQQRLEAVGDELYTSDKSSLFGIRPDGLTFQHSGKFSILFFQIFPFQQGINDNFSRHRQTVEIPVDRAAFE